MSRSGPSRGISLADDSGALDAQRESSGRQQEMRGRLERVLPGIAGRSGSHESIPAGIARIVLHFGMVWALLAVVVAARILYPGFLEPANIANVFSQNAPIGIVAIGMTLVMIAGGFDLSVGAIFGASGVIYAAMSNRVPLFPALLVALGAGCGLGVINGLVVTKLKVNPFVATLGSASMFSGVTFIYTHSNPMTSNSIDFMNLGLGKTLGVANATWILIGVFVVGGLVLARTVFGRALYAVGGNPEAARLAGVPVDALRIATYAIVGFCSALAGAILASRVQVGEADLGATTALDAIAIVVIGGTSLFGGEGAMWRTGIGVLIIGCITNLSDSLGWNVNTQSVIKGAIIIGAVALDVYTRGRRK